jgi:hypothetical protein
MAKKLYIFGIGGTGSRVIKALCMLFAAGCKLENGFDTVIPIIIDPDTSNGDLNRTKDILRLYQEIRNQVYQPNDFYQQELKTINELADNSPSLNPDYFQFKLEGIDSSSFKQYIGFDSLSDDFNNSKDDKNFIRLLYSEENLKSDLNVGFKGNPNMGSIVLNQFTNSKDFQKFGQTFGPDDAIFIINSIFGGTGAAGFPLLLKNLKGNENLPHISQIRDAPIGGITYLPYFSLNKSSESSIDSDSFEEKAKIAIDYYNRTIISQNKINVLYFIGNKSASNVYENFEGKAEQKNDGHFLELAGALSVMDFCKNIESYKVVDGLSVNQTQIKEFGIENDTDSITFNDLNIENVKQLSSPLTKFRLYTEYLTKGLPIALNISRWTKSNIKLVNRIKNSSLDINYFNSAEYMVQIKAFNKYFSEWINEMGNNKPSFCPFYEINAEDALKLVKNKVPKGDLSFKALDVKNCLLIDQVSIKSPLDKKHTTLIKLFGQSTEDILAHKNLLIQ